MHAPLPLSAAARCGAVGAASLLAAACMGMACTAPAAPAHPEVSAGPDPAPELGQQPASAEPPADSVPVVPGEPCGALDCRRFDDAASALRYVLQTAPLALGIGEA